MEKPSWGKWGSWEETESYLGKQIGKSVGADQVEKGSIRKWLESKEFDCPLHYDDEVAKNAGYEDVVAPCTMVLTYGVRAYWKPGDPSSELGNKTKGIQIPIIYEVPAPCTLSFASNIDIEFYSSMIIGDRITCTSKFTDISYKELKVGKGAFMLQEDTYTNKRGEVVAVSKLTIFRFVPPKEGEK